MYERHWQLTAAPFRHHCGSEFFFRTAGHQSALLKLRFVLEQRQASATLLGPTGVGKSYLLRVLQDELPESIGPVILLNYPDLTPLELVRYLCAELAAHIDAPPQRAEGMDQWLRVWEDLMLRAKSQSRLPVFLVDDAHVIDDRAVWQTWQLLLTFRERDAMNFSLVFAGQPELAGRLQRCPQLEERLALVCTLSPLSSSETAEYIRHRLLVAGRKEPIFEHDAVQRIWECSGGLPRRIDRLCDFALLVGYADGARNITIDQIDGVARELRGRAA